MQNKIQIDEFVRQQVLDKEAQLNIGAWSNMERLLNGENPYASTTEDVPNDAVNKTNWKKLLGLLLLVIVAGGTALFSLVGNKTKLAQNKLPANFEKPSTANNSNNDLVNIVENTTINTPENTINNNAFNNNSNTTNNPTNDVQNTPTSYQASNSEPVIATGSNPNSEAHVSYAENNSYVSNNNPVIASNSHTKRKNKSNYVSQYNAYSIATETNYEANGTTNYQAADVITSTSVEVKASRKARKAKQSLMDNGVPTSAQQATNNLNVEPSNEAFTSKVVTDAPKVPKKSKANKKAGMQLDNQKNSQQPATNEDEIKKSLATKVPKDSVTKIVLTKKAKKGSRGKMTYESDTVSITKTEKLIEKAAESIEEAATTKVNEVVNTVKITKAAKAKLAPEKTNPRYNPNAQKVQKAKQVFVEPVLANAKTPANNTLGLKYKNIDDTKKPKTKSKASAFEVAYATALQATIEQIKKVGYIKLFHTKIPVNPGIFAGLNASVFNNVHDYGGYHVGANVLMKIGRNLNLVPHLTFFAKNNSGYSIRDNALSVTQQSAPQQYSPNWYAYSAKYDSTVYVHNFKRIYSIEAPLALQYNRKNLAVYGGVNFAYNFKLKTNTVTKGYGYGQANQEYFVDTVYSTTAPVYAYPVTRSSFYKAPDFNGRFGVGYVAGMNFHFTSKFFIDARVTQNMWDNSATASSLEISKKMFRLPSYQITLGYRFKDNFE